jgi:hypothetical protein
MQDRREFVADLALQLWREPPPDLAGLEGHAWPHNRFLNLHLLLAILSFFIRRVVREEELHTKSEGWQISSTH